MTTAERTRIFTRLEVADALRSRWLGFACALYAVVFGAFIWLGLRESSVLGFTGLSRVVLNVANAVVVTVPLVALVATSQAIVRARSTGLFELLLAQPARRGEWFRGLVLSRLVVLLGPLLLLLALAGVIGLGLDPSDSTLLPIILNSIAIVGALQFAFIGIGLYLSSLARTPERAIVYALIAWMLSTALHDFALIGALLQLRVEPKVVFALAALNPVEAARIAVLSSVVPELSVLGPVGFWIANQLGPARALWAGIAWPLLLGAVTLWLAQRRLQRSDLVG